MRQKVQHDQLAKDRRINPGGPVLVRNFTPGPQCLPGEIIQRTGPVLFTAKVSYGYVVK